jgi:hypothetical protein
MAFTTDELGAMLNILMKHSDWTELSKEINYDVHDLNRKILSEMSAAILYDLECE